jgi:hypothetical protein
LTPCAIDLSWLPRQEYHFHFYCRDIAAGYAIQEIIREPDDSIDIRGVRNRGHEAAIDEKSLGSDRSRQLYPASKLHRKATSPGG